MSVKKQIYAVVDLETTGTKRGVDQVIQFGCVMIQKNKIVNTISQNINPKQAIPRAITDLTGIDASQVQDAPTFAEIGPSLRNMLEDTIFVAHNVNFDFPFLNAAFESIGLPALNIAAIDTVELAQIFLPTAVSYKLQDLANLLSIEHKNPHHADSDAFVTAKLFLALKKRMENTPQLTLAHIAKLSDLLTRQTGDYIRDLADKQPKKPLPSYLHVNHGLVLRNRRDLQAQPLHQLTNFPKSPGAKKKLFTPLLHYRSSQAKMMNLIYDHLNQPVGAPLLIEAETGSGKTLGYMLPSYFMASHEHKIVISTATTVLQNQLLDQTIPLVEQLLAAKVPVALVKSENHYLNLEVFYQSLLIPSSNRPTRLLQLRLLVWLTMTKTGDIAELQLTNYHNYYLQRITDHNGRQHLFGPDEFMTYIETQAKQASIILTNHSYLLAHEDSALFGQQATLIVDEADEFARSVSRTHNHTSHFQEILDCLHQLAHHHEPLADAAAAIYPAYAQLNKGYAQIDNLLATIKRVQSIFFESYIQDNLPKSKRSRPIDEIIDLSGLDIPKYVLPELKQILELGQSINVNLTQALNQLTNLEQQFNHQTISLLNQILSMMIQFQNAIDDYQQFMTQMLTQSDNTGILLQMKQYGNVETLDLAIHVLDPGMIAQTLFQRFGQVVLTGATLTFNHKFDYFLNQMHLNKNEVSTYKLDSPFDYENQTRLITIADAPDIKSVSPSYFSDYITGVIDQMAQASTGQLLVLFNSLDMLKQTYYTLKETLTGHEKEILAQGITGSNEKIFKRFSLSEHAVLLGSNSFLSGIDFPGDHLKALILTRLPFESPAQPEVKLRYNWLQQQGIDPFSKDSLPKTAFKVKQGFGRLIRQETDKGVMVVLDNRLTNTTYGHEILRSLPKQVHSEVLTLREAIPAIKNFLRESGTSLV
ncbi:MAG: ribonuclease H-like domain-containing protein [Lactobacillus sp.]|jgi:ATP-dependent DNA helicase DinG|nr:ribonuclease H-like domain-containing protein [Lactobacillus sp.]